MPNDDEFQADTNPLSQESDLRMLGIRSTTGGVEVIWRGGIESWLYLEYRTRLVSTSDTWIIIFTNEPPTDVTNSVLDMGATNRANFYRIKARRQ